MLQIGLTGGIGAGKSTVGRRLTERGAVLIDSDVLAREVVAPGTQGLRDLVAQFGEQVLADDGSLDRPALASTVFGDDDALARLNAIVHPRVGARSAELLEGAGSDAIVVQDIPLLVENAMAPGLPLVVVVHADESTRVQRLAAARGMSEADARSRMAAQASDAQRREAADVWLDNGGPPEHTRDAVDRLWDSRLRAFEENLRHQRYAAGGAPRLAEADPGWPGEAERLVRRVRTAAGSLARRVDHIGSTSIPGLAAKDRIDLQLTVDSWTDADAVRPALQRVGFVHLPDLADDSPKPGDPDPAHWRKQTYASADPGRHANLHVRLDASPGVRYALLFRDWLRAEPAERADYETLKRGLAEAFARDTGVAGYAEAKDPWFTAAHERSERWASATGWTY